MLGKLQMMLRNINIIEVYNSCIDMQSNDVLKKAFFWGWVREVMDRVGFANAAKP